MRCFVMFVTAVCILFLFKLKWPKSKYLLLTEFEVRTVSYWPSFSHSIYGPSGKRAAINRRGKKPGSVTYGTDRKTRLVRYYYISILGLTGSETISIHEERLQISEAGRKQNKSIWNHFKSLAHFSTQFRVIESFKLLFASQVERIWW